MQTRTGPHAFFIISTYCSGMSRPSLSTARLMTFQVTSSVAHLLHLEHPPRGDPGPGAERVEPEAERGGSHAPILPARGPAAPAGRRGRAGPTAPATRCRSGRMTGEERRGQQQQPHPGRGARARGTPAGGVLRRRPRPARPGERDLPLHDHRPLHGDPARRRHLHRGRGPLACAPRRSTASRSTCPASTASAWRSRAGGRQRARGRRRLRLHAHRRGPAPLRRPGRRRGLPLHAVRDLRRAPHVRLLRPARPQGRRSASRSRRPAGLGRASATARCPTARPRASRAAGVRRRRRGCRRTSPPSSPAPTPRARRARRHPARAVLPRLARAAPRRRRAVRRHQAGLRLLPPGVRLPLPVRQVRPALRAGVQRGRDGERRRGDVPRGLRLPLQGHRRRLRAPRRDGAARDGAHVVRRPRDDALVGRPVAQRVVRHVHVRARPGRGHPLDRRLDDLRQRREDLGLPPGPAALDAPHRRRHPRHRGRRGQLRRHHLRQGRVGAQAARRLGRAGRLPRRRCATYFPDARVRQHRAAPTCSPSSRRQRARPVRWSTEWLETAGVNTLRPSFETGADGAFTSFSVLQEAPADAPDAALAPASRSACYDLVDGALVRTAPRGARRRRRQDRGARRSSGGRSPTWCWSTTTT